MNTNFTRTMYDQENLEMFDTTVKDQNRYIMNIDSVENNSACYATSGARNASSQVARPLNKNGVLALGVKVDLESKLQNRHVELNSFKNTNKDYADVKIQNPNKCSLKENDTDVDTRFNEGPSREKYTAEYNFAPYIHMNPQGVLSNNDDIMPPTRYGQSTRHNFIKENENKTKKNIISEQKNKKPYDIFQGYLPSGNNKDIPSYLQ
jgi:hypothetical protein